MKFGLGDIGIPLAYSMTTITYTVGHFGPFGALFSENAILPVGVPCNSPHQIYLPEFLNFRLKKKKKKERKFERVNKNTNNIY